MKVNYDIETIPIGGGYKRGEMVVFAAGRQTGKSMLNHMFTPAKFTILDQAPVDGATWYTVSCSREVSIWLREQSEELQKHNLSCEKWPMYSNKYDIHEKLYTVLALKWS